jgi:hypothetical protein
MYLRGYCNLFLIIFLLNLGQNDFICIVYL